jgi:hypothetical protein
MAIRKADPSARRPEGSYVRPRLLYVDDVHCVGLFHDVLIMLSRGAPSLQFLQHSMRLIREAAKDAQTGLGLFIVISADAPPPPDDAREFFTRSTGELASTVGAMARVIEGEGFLAAAKRSAIAMVQLAARSPFPSKIFGTQAEGSAWLVQTLSQTAKRRYAAADLLAATRELRQAHNVSKPPR